jgi:hypothetical protein
MQAGSCAYRKGLNRVFAIGSNLLVTNSQGWPWGFSILALRIYGLRNLMTIQHDLVLQRWYGLKSPIVAMPTLSSRRKAALGDD